MPREQNNAPKPYRPQCSLPDDRSSCKVGRHDDDEGRADGAAWSPWTRPGRRPGVARPGMPSHDQRISVKLSSTSGAARQRWRRAGSASDAVPRGAGVERSGLADPGEDVVVDLAGFLQVQEMARIIDHDHARGRGEEAFGTAGQVHPDAAVAGPV